MHHGEFEDPRLVVVYDAESPWSAEDEFFCAVIAEFAPEPQRGSSTRVLDVGCGTGRLATGLAGAGYEVTGLDPARASIEFARSREGGETVTWIEGTSQEIPETSFEVAVMSKHVAQFFVSDDAWATVLADVSAALVPGGILTFDMRDARNREWDEWTPDAVDVVTLPDGREVEEWTEITDETSNTVRFRTHYTFPDGTTLTSTATLAFRDLDDLQSSLSGAGFSILHAFGGWQRQPLGEGDGEILVVARRLP